MANRKKSWLFSVVFSLCFFLPASLTFLRAQKGIDPEETLFLDFALPVDSPAAQGLTPNQVRISVAGRPGEVTCLTRIDPSRFNVSDPNAWMVINQIRGGQALIFLLDLNSLDQESLEQTRSTVKHLLNSMPEGSRRYMLATLGSRLSFLQSFTPDKDRITESLGTIIPAQKRLDYKTFIESLATIFTVQYRQDRDQALDESIREANIFLNEIKNRAESTIEGLGMFAEFFESLSGPKHVLLFSGGYPMKPGQVVQDILRTYNQAGGTGISPAQRSIRIGGGDDNVSPGDTAASMGESGSGNVAQGIMSADILSAKMGSDNEAVSPENLSRLILRLNRNQVILHAFDSRDVRTDSLAASGISELPSQLVGRHNSSHITAGREFLEAITAPTGGRLVTDREALSACLDDNRSIRYLAGIKSDRKKKAKEEQSKITVELDEALRNHPLLSARTSPFTLRPVHGDEYLAGVFNFPGYHHDFSAGFDYSIKKDEITGTINLSPREMGFTRENNNYLCMLEIFGILTDSEGKAVTGSKKYTFAKQFPLRMNADQYKTFLARDTVTASASAGGIPPGEYRLTMVARQPGIGLVSASTMAVVFEY